MASKRMQTYLERLRARASILEARLAGPLLDKQDILQELNSVRFAVEMLEARIRMDVKGEITMMGPGKYDEACRHARKLTGGGVVLIVFDGKAGSGFAAQLTADMTMVLPVVLRQVADEVELHRSQLPAGHG